MNGWRNDADKRVKEANISEAQTQPDILAPITYQNLHGRETIKKSNIKH